MYDIKDVIDFYRTKGSIDLGKLNYLLYQAYVTVLMNNESDTENQIRLFECEINAAPNGPRVKELYQLFEQNYFDDKQTFPEDDEYTWLISELEGMDTSIFDAVTLQDLETTWELYGKYSRWDLESFIMDFSPWRTVREKANLPNPLCACKENLTDDILFEHYINEYHRDDDTADMTQEPDDILYDIHRNLILAINTAYAFDKVKYQKLIECLMEAIRLCDY